MATIENRGKSEYELDVEMLSFVISATGVRSMTLVLTVGRRRQTGTAISSISPVLIYYVEKKPS